MAIIGQNSLLNQYVPTFYIKDIVDGQCLIYDAVRRAFVNTTLCGCGCCDGGTSPSVLRLGELLNVDDQVDNPLSLENGQALVYNSFTQLWENQFIDYNTILNAPLVVAPANEIIFGDSSGTGFASDPGLTYDPGVNTLSANIINADTIHVSLIASTTSLTFITNNFPRLIINGNGSFNIGGSTGTPGQVLTSSGSGSSPTWTPTTSGGTVTSVSATGGVTGLGFLGSPITTSGTLTLAGTLNINSGGTGATTQSSAINNLLPPQTGNAGRVLSTDGTNVTWTASSGIGTVTSVSVIGAQGISVTGSPIITVGTIALGLGDITPTSVTSPGTVTGSNISGSNTGDQTITLTGDVVGSGTGTFPTELSLTGVVAGVYGDATLVPQFIVDDKGRISSVVEVPITGGGGGATPEIVVLRFSSGSGGNLSAVDAIYSETSGVTATVTDGANSIVEYSFPTKLNLPKSITLYGQNFTTNTFSIVGMPGPNASQPNINVAGGGTAALPDLVQGLFTSANVVTLQTTMAFVGASATLGNRAWLIVVFGF
jgi:hypothetical protein